MKHLKFCSNNYCFDTRLRLEGILRAVLRNDQVHPCMERKRRRKRNGRRSARLVFKKKQSRTINLLFFCDNRLISRLSDCIAALFLT